MINFKTFTHKGDVIVTISEPVERLVLTPDEADGLAKVLTEAAKEARGQPVAPQGRKTQ